MKTLDLRKYNKEINSKTYLYYRSVALGEGPCRINPGEWTWTNNKKDLLEHYKHYFIDELVKQLLDTEKEINIKDLRNYKYYVNYRPTIEEIIILYEYLNETNDDLSIQLVFTKMTLSFIKLNIKSKAFYFSNYEKALKLVEANNSKIYKNDLGKTFQHDISI